ncbi:hypothetical protein EVAR_37125_1 [Eumeta japonica]|uniref:Uncharacterized protein n=1 Tax=Eumeta variegata TaxID=151549 RepID=A0A4C1XSX2_EUMVA|nr:hypothetical protein EVAR_37125_1 [Eumeta japonica]
MNLDQNIYSIICSIPSQKTCDPLVTSLRLRVSMGGGEHQLSDLPTDSTPTTTIPADIFESLNKGNLSARGRARPTCAELLAVTEAREDMQRSYHMEICSLYLPFWEMCHELSQLFAGEGPRCETRISVFDRILCENRVDDTCVMSKVFKHDGLNLTCPVRRYRCANCTDVVMQRRLAVPLQADC